MCNYTNTSIKKHLYCTEFFLTFFNLLAGDDLFKLIPTENCTLNFKNTKFVTSVFQIIIQKSTHHHATLFI